MNIPRHLFLTLAAACFLLFAEAANAQEIFIRLNQIGFRPNDPKTAVVFSKGPLPETFALVDDAKRTVVFTASLRLTGGKWGEFERHAIADFSSWNTSGKYSIRVGNTVSVPFVIEENVFQELLEQLLEFMRQQRCGYNPWLDSVCHQFDGRTAFGPLTNGSYLNCSGGWHDAGDLLKYLLTSGNATAQMLLAFELQKSSNRSNPVNHLNADHFNALGQPGTNGIPDILDEARWGLEWMLKLHPAPDQLYHQVADDRDHYGWRLPQEEQADYGWGKGSYRVVYCADGKPQGLAQFQSESDGLANLAGRYAAAMALAYQIWKDDPRERGFAQKCLQAGVEVYALGKAKEGVQQGNSFKAPYRYEETTWADDMEWGAAELYRATGKKNYLSDGKLYASRAANETWMGKEQTKHYQYYPFMNVGHFRLHGIVDKKVQKQLEQYYAEGIKACIAMGKKNPYQAGVPFIWCSNNLLTALATQCLFYERMSGDKEFAQFSAEQRDWLLGRNPWGTSMFTGIPLGGVYPHHPHLMTTKITGRSIRGGLVDGPVYERIFKGLKGVGITEPDPFAAFQGELAVYHDDLHDYSSNEPTMDGTASAILLWSLCR